MARRAKPTRSRSRRSWPRRIFGWLCRGIAIFFIGSLLWVLLYKFVPPPMTFTMIGDWTAGRGIEKDWMPLSRMDPNMARAVIAGEDGKFCTHSGFDADAIEDAIKRNAKGGRIRGGSTISQQTAKNAFLWQGGGFFRKGLEAYFTLLIEWIWGKPRIMEVYLNVAETGIGTYGANAGAQRYFGHDASRLTPTEAARIAAVLPLPKKRAAIDPGGFTRKHGNRLARWVNVIRRDGYDRCLR
ncbi:monofunctional biosynthetic peptidoglycan transglycosylase [Sphingobium boeckii]|uniref:Biosynthetic peptidoglycan transglycosylase n=1 Tax=Sphingobium boeckii TaxID=1082345 RepID=A0A7W9AKC3_9SPHN|nr:monofunctional biosynthetic peptidoglycan transglycosylase [Sphingobium boeckii]MBB5687148.1 monofunctional biosynthetic peptidoglycan transglycosylase [Sphingobium boeckii]